MAVAASPHLRFITALTVCGSCSIYICFMLLLLLLLLLWLLLLVELELLLLLLLLWLLLLVQILQLLPRLLEPLHVCVVHAAYICCTTNVCI